MERKAGGATIPMPRWLLPAALTLALGLHAGALAQAPVATPLRGPELLAALRAGGYILYFRHADTDHRQNDDRMTSVEDCPTQRNLTDRGRDHARAIGEAIRALGIPIGAVLASPLAATFSARARPTWCAPAGQISRWWPA